MNKIKHAILAKKVAAALAVAGMCIGSQARADSQSGSPSSPSDKHIYVGNYDMSTNLWGIGGVTSEWYEEIFTNSTSNMMGSGWKWTGFNTTTDPVKAYPSIRRGASNANNNPASSGLPYLFGSNTKNVDVIWQFTATGYDGTGSIAGRYNHALDVFFSTVSVKDITKVKGEIMVIPDSWADSQTQGWGTKDPTPFVIDGETWDVWQATQSSNGNTWTVLQFRKRVKSNYFNKNLKRFFAEAALRRSDVFMSQYYVLMVEAGTEVKYGSGKVYNQNYQVSVY
jgi:hypothetical protein